MPLATRVFGAGALERLTLQVYPTKVTLDGTYAWTCERGAHEMPIHHSVPWEEAEERGWVSMLGPYVMTIPSEDIATEMLTEALENEGPQDPCFWEHGL